MTRRSNLPARPLPAIRRQSGLSLVELMISVTIGLVILAAMVGLFVNTSRSNRELSGANTLIENGRLAIQLIEGDVVHAGFFSAFVPEFDNQTIDIVPTDVPTAVPNPCLAYSTANWNAAYVRNLLGIPVQVYDSNAVCSAVVTDKVAGTDVLVVRHAEPCVAGEGGNCPDEVAGRLYFQSSLCATEATHFVLSDADADFTLANRNCTTVADKYRFMSSIYYIRSYANDPSDGIPTLVRSQFDFDGAALGFLPAQAMIEGVDGFHVELGVDDVSETGDPVDYTAAIDWDDPDTRTAPNNRGDGSPDGDFVTCTTLAPCTAARLMNVTAVKLYLLVRSREPSPGYVDTKSYTLGATGIPAFNDGYKRHVFETTIRLPNIAGRRETP